MVAALPATSEYDELRKSLDGLLRFCAQFLAASVTTGRVNLGALTKGHPPIKFRKAMSHKPAWANQVETATKVTAKCRPSKTRLTGRSFRLVAGQQALPPRRNC